MAKTIERDFAAPRFAWNKELGRKGESIAREWLVSQRWRILHTNWRAGRFGEIDLIARDEQGLLVFCEVKTRILRSNAEAFRNDGFEAVHWHKRRKIIACASSYMSRNHSNAPDGWRFDVVTIEFELRQLNLENAKAFRLDAQSFALLSKIQPTIRHARSAFC